MRNVLSGGAPLSPDTHEQIQLCLCVDVIQGYGLTETTSGATVMDSKFYSFFIVIFYDTCRHLNTRTDTRRHLDTFKIFDTLTLEHNTLRYLDTYRLRHLDTWRRLHAGRHLKTFDTWTLSTLCHLETQTSGHFETLEDLEIHWVTWRNLNT